MIGSIVITEDKMTMVKKKGLYQVIKAMVQGTNDSGQEDMKKSGD